MNQWPEIIYRRPLTGTYFREDGTIFVQIPNFIITYYHYSHSTFDRKGEVEVWKLKDAPKNGREPE